MSSLTFAASILCIYGIAQLPQSGFGSCDSRELKYRLSPEDPAYGSAMQLAQTLSSHGIKVNCVLPSKMVNFFMGQKGAVVFRTDHGHAAARDEETQRPPGGGDALRQRRHGDGTGAGSGVAGQLSITCCQLWIRGRI